MNERTVPVLVPVPVDSPFDYLWTAVEDPVPGRLVEVPFGPRRLPGVVWDQPPERRASPGRLRAIHGLLDCPPLPPPLLRLIAWTARETLMPLGAVLRLALPVSVALEPQARKTGLVAAPGVAMEGLTAGRRRVIAVAREASEPLPAAELARRAGTSAGVVKALVAAGLLLPQPVPEPEVAAPDPTRPGPQLSSDQERAAATLRALVAERRAEPVVLAGVPGSGKTEVYFEAIAEALRRGRRVLVLLPEIALSAQWLERFAARFGARPAVWHSALSSAERRRSWRRIAEGQVTVVVGARSALFLPLRELGLIVVDEEHDPSFKQDEGTVYDARAGAIARAGFEGCPVVLASATPSLASHFHSGTVRAFPPPHPPWPRLVLPARHGAAVLPEIRLVDLRRERPPAHGFLAPPAREALTSTVAAGEQALVFLNRRGYAPLTLCRACGHRLRCPNCSAWLVQHRLRRRLLCHHCGWSRPEPDHCPLCGAVEVLVGCGPGVERVAEEVAGLLPNTRIFLATSDTVRTAADAETLVREVTERRIDVLVGTQILAKGHHFPALTLVVAVDADLGLSGGDLDACERSFQLLYQMAGRAGRGERPGRVLIQTYQPEHPVMQAVAAGDLDAFLANELAERAAAAMPPFGRLAALVVSGSDATRVRSEAQRLVRAASEPEGVRVLGPAPAPLAMLRGRYRERILVLAAPGIDLPSFLRDWLAGVRLSSAVRLQIDVDPRSFL
ncbi:Primosomal protein N' [bacterium HR40]|nr:Primosomal protein N' [bacterium HR40]